MKLKEFLSNLDIKCPHCESNNLIKKGTRQKLKILSKQFHCKDCKKYFLVDIDRVDLAEGNFEKYGNKQVIDINDCFEDEFEENKTDKEIIEANVKLAKQKQRYQDSNRIERKAFREYSRVENAIAEYSKELVKLLKNNNLSEFTIYHENISNDAVGVLQISDTHFNELVHMQSNQYDFTIASKRLKKFVMKAKKYFSVYNIKNVVVLLTGDLINSDRRLDELLNMATNRSKATFLAVQMLEQVLLDLNLNYNVTVANVIGNESRVGKDVEWSDIVASDNYDYTIFNFLKYIFKDSKGIVFKESASPKEDIINIAGKNFLMLHGNQKTYGKDPHNGVKSSIAKYANKGVIVDFVVFGHLHEPLVSNNFARCGSLVGSNAYAEDGLQLVSKASQNLYLVFKDCIETIVVDLQDVTDINGYDIKNELEAYNAKSADKVKPHKTIFEVQI